MIASPDFRPTDDHSAIVKTLKLNVKLWLTKGIPATPLRHRRSPSLGEASDGGLDKDGFELP